MEHHSMQRVRGHGVEVENAGDASMPFGEWYEEEGCLRCGSRQER